MKEKGVAVSKDPREEQRLTQEGVEWHYDPEIPMSKIDHEASLKNQARFKAINQDHVIELAIAAEQFDLPALVGYYNKERRIIIIDGNHRMEAYNLVGKTKSDFYIVGTAYSWVIDRLTRLANMKEGWPPTREEKLNHAIHFVRVQNMPVETAAKSCGLRAGTVFNALYAAEVGERLAKLGFDEKLYSSALEALHRIKQDSALLESAKLIHQAQLTGDETVELARRVSKARSEKTQQAVIDDLRHQFRSRIARTRAGQMKRQILPTVKLRKYVDGINSLRPESVKPLDKDLDRKRRYAIKKLVEMGPDEPQSE